jgi:hypothetical protein
MTELDSIEAVVAAWRVLTASQRQEVRRLAGPPRRSTAQIVHAPSVRELEAEGFTKTGPQSHVARWRPPAVPRAQLREEQSKQVAQLQARIRDLEEQVRANHIPH